MEDFVTYCKDYVAEHLPGYEGQKVYLSDLGYKITEGPNQDGSVTYSRAAAMDYLKEWWEEAADYFDYEKYEYGQNVMNPFDNPEGYMVCMLIEGVAALIFRSVEELGIYDLDENEVNALRVAALAVRHEGGTFREIDWSMNLTANVSFTEKDKQW